jgi:hypothetical protein
MRSYQPERQSFVTFAFAKPWSGSRDGFTHENFDKGLNADGTVICDGDVPIVYDFPLHIAENMRVQGYGDIMVANYTAKHSKASVDATVGVTIEAKEPPGVAIDIIADVSSGPENKAPEIAAHPVKPTKAKGSAK